MSRRIHDRDASKRSRKKRARKARAVHPILSPRSRPRIAVRSGRVGKPARVVVAQARPIAAAVDVSESVAVLEAIGEGHDAAIDEGSEIAEAGTQAAEVALAEAGGDDDEATGGGEAEAPAPAVATRRRDDDQGNFLSLYFREMARLSVLQPEEEFKSARQIEQLEIELWARMLAFAPLSEHLLVLAEKGIGKSFAESKPLRRALTDHKRRATHATDERVQRTALVAAAQLREVDLDKDHLEEAVAEVRRLAVGQRIARLAAGRLPVNLRSRIFRDFVREVMTLNARIAGLKNEFVKANLRLVVSIARRFNHGRMPLPDLIQEGNIGLIKAVERYDYRRGYRFSTYASWWIRHAISRALADKGRAVRLPVHMIDAYHRVAKSKRELTGKLGRTPTSDEIGDATGIPAVKIEKMRTYLLDQSFSLDRPVSDEDGRKFIDFLADPNAETAPTDRLVDAAINKEVHDLLGHLKPIEADILRQRFGLDTDKELTLKEIGEKYNLSRERIRQLQEQALLKMRRALQRKDMM